MTKATISIFKNPIGPLKILIFLTISSIILSKLVFNEEKNIYQGTEDDYSTELYSRRINSNNNQDVKVVNFKIEQGEKFNKFLGVEDWGPISNNLLMQEWPDDYKKAMLPCSVKKGELSYKMINTAKLDNMDEIYDWSITKNEIFILTSNVEVLYYNILQSEDEESTKIKEIKNSFESPRKIFKSTYSKDPSSAGISSQEKSNGSRLVFLVSDLGTLVINQEKKESSEKGSIKTITVPVDQIEPHSDIVYVDINDKYLFVGYKFEGIMIYDISDEKKIKKVGEINSKWFDTKSILSSEDSVLLFNDFNVKSNHVGVYNSKDKSENLENECVNCHDLFEIDYNTEDRLKWLETKIIHKDVMFVATNIGQYAQNLTDLFSNGEMPDKFYENYIDIKDIQRVTRFQDQVYLQATPQSKDYREVYEIFLYDYKFDKWDKKKSSDNLYKINRKIKAENRPSMIYADEDYLYTVGDKIHMFYERGINSDFLKDNNSIGKAFVDKDLLSIMKIILNGKDYVITVNSDFMNLYSVRMSKPIFSCLQDYQKSDSFPQGNFVFHLNSTTRSCPTKINDEEYQNGKNKFDYTCLLQLEIHITLAKTYFCSDCSKNDLLKYCFTILGVGIIVFLCCFIYCAKRNKNSYKRLEKEFSDLKQQKDQMPNKHDGEDAARDAQNKDVQGKFALNFGDDSNSSPSKVKDEEKI